MTGTFTWDRLCTAIFAPRIFKAMLDEAKALTLADAAPAIGSLLKVLGVFLLLGTGNILIIGMAFWMYKKHTAKMAEAEAAK